MTLQIRPATLADAARLSAIVLAHQAVLTLDPSGAGAEAFLERVSPAAIAANLASDRYLHVVAEEAGEVIGFAALRDTQHLFHLFVAPGHQGQGVGRRLWQQLQGQAQAQGHHGAFTVNASPGSVAVYLRLGFVTTGSRQEMHGIAYIPMRLEPLGNGPG